MGTQGIAWPMAVRITGQQISWEAAEASDYTLPPAVEECSWDMDPPTQPDENGVYPVCAVPGFTTNI